MRIFVHGGKGKQDRYAILSKDLRLYFAKYKQEWLFEGQRGGACSIRGMQAILCKVIDKSKVDPYTTVYVFRHSFATYLLEQGVGLRHIQEFLGHSYSSITESHTH